MMSTRNSISSINLTSSIPNSRKARPLPAWRRRSAPPWGLRACTASSPWPTKNRPLRCGTSLSWRGRWAGPSPPHCRTSLLSRGGRMTAFRRPSLRQRQGRRRGEKATETRKAEGLRRKAEWQSGRGEWLLVKHWEQRIRGLANPRLQCTGGGTSGRLLLVGLEGQMRRGITVPRSLLCVCLDRQVNSISQGSHFDIQA